MKMTIERAALLKPLQIISGVVERRQTSPILANVLIKVQENQVSLTATDTEIELIGTAPLKQPGEPGDTTVSAKKLLDISRVLPEDALLEFVLEGDHLLLRSGKSRFMLATLPAHDFPSIKNRSDFTTEFTLSQSKLKNLLEKTYFSMGQQDVRHYLNGILIDINQGVMKCVATDGHRLAFSSMNDNCFSHASTKIILPRKSVLELMRLLDTNNETPISIHINENHFCIISPDFTLTSKLISAQYPDYEKLIPHNTENTVIASCEALKQALVRASVLLSEKFRGVRLQLERDMLRIMANNPEQEETEELVHLDYKGDSTELAFNAAYLLDVVSAMTSEQIRWSFSTQGGGVLMEAIEKMDSLYVVMPIRL
jgi:DNA polymerase-3 subunit beta